MLNDYDQETNDFYRWKVIYTQEEISELVRRRTGIDFGIITDLVPAASGNLRKDYKTQDYRNKEEYDTSGKSLKSGKLFQNHIFTVHAFM
ncbi:MAG: hypothetical protein MZV63_60615 [Marinilabiliales bacterium]|nr:hypothetical protein [Marinilabiliales bacterium]